MWVKICGIQNCKTATDVLSCGADAIGLNFYSPSPRSISVTDAQRIVEILPAHVTPVGLFVNHTLSEVVESCQQLNLNIVQLHGDEPPDYLAELLRHLPMLKIIRAWRMDKEGIVPLSSYIKSCTQLDVSLFACLVDSHMKGTYGGTGKTVAWNQLAKEYNQAEMPPLILAGGLTPTNVAEAISTVNPWGVDVASGVESSVGVKEISRIKKFISEAKKSFS